MRGTGWNLLSHCGNFFLGIPTICLPLLNTVHIEVKNILHISFLTVHTTFIVYIHIHTIYILLYVHTHTNADYSKMYIAKKSLEISQHSTPWIQFRMHCRIGQKWISRTGGGKDRMSSKNEQYQVGKRQTGAIMQKNLKNTKGV